MSHSNATKLVASALVVALAGAGSVSFAAPPTAILTGSVLGAQANAPLVGATVVVTDAAGAALTSSPTAADGSFTVTGVPAGRQKLTIATEGGSFDVVTPIVLAPGETKSVRVALRRAGDADDKDKKKGGGYWTGGAKGAMIAVLVGFAAAGAYGISQSGDDETQPAASASNPD